MEKLIAGVALVRHPLIEKPAWLVRLDSRSNLYRPIVGQRLEGESYREAADRELAWSLGLRRSRDYLISSVPRLHLDLPLASGCSGESCFFVLEFFIANLFGKRSLAVIDADPANYWASVEELLSGTMASGRLLAEPWATVLKRGDILPISSTDH